MATEGLLFLIRFNVVAGAAIAMVLLLRPFVRRWLGAHQTYVFWLTVPVALAGLLIPPMESSGAVGPLESAADVTRIWLWAGTHRWLVAEVWALGVLVSTVVIAWRYAAFLSQARSGRAGPAIVGIVAPRLVTPSDFQARFTPAEQRLVRAHERAHMDRLDPRWNAVILAAQCLNWFNPLVHLAARAVRFDQELACDATVMAKLPTQRRLYAETLLRSHCGTASPLGCGWSGAGARLLTTRLTTLLGRRPGTERSELGDMLIAGLWTCVLGAAWLAQPPDRRPYVIFLDISPAHVTLADQAGTNVGSSPEAPAP